jgi:hypothetical protein
VNHDYGTSSAVHPAALVLNAPDVREHSRRLNGFRSSMGNRHPSSFAKRAREAAKRAKKQEKLEKRAQRATDREEDDVAPEHDPDIDWSAAVGVTPPPGALDPPPRPPRAPSAEEDEEKSDEADASTGTAD